MHEFFRQTGGPLNASCRLRDRGLMLLSVLIPVYNERNTLGTVLSIVSRALPGVEKEIIVVDDCSTDGTRDWLRATFPNGARSGTSVDVAADGSLSFGQAPSGGTVTIKRSITSATRGRAEDCRRRSRRRAATWS